jgi:hypothetical protein
MVILVAYLTLAAITASLWDRPKILLVGHIALGVLLIWRWHRLFDIIVFVAVGVLGTLADATLVRSGAWRFAGERIVPLWLPLAWASTGLIIARAGSFVREQVLKRFEYRADSDSERNDPLANLRLETSRILIGAIVCATLFFIVLITAQLVWTEATPDTWLLRLIKQRYAALIQTPLLAGLAFCIVCLLEVVAGEKIEFEAPGFKFRGAAGPVVLWIFVFLALATMTYTAWSLPGFAH